MLVVRAAALVVGDQRHHRRAVSRFTGLPKWVTARAAVDSTGQTIDFLLTAKRDAAGAKRFFRKMFAAEGNPTPRVVNVDKNRAYPAAIEALKADGTLPRRVRLRQCKYLNNIVEQDHRTVRSGCGSLKDTARFRARGGRCRESKRCT